MLHSERLYEKLNEKVITCKPMTKFTHENSMVWKSIENSFLSMISPTPEQLSVTFYWDGNEITLELSNGYTEKTTFTLEGVRGNISRAKNNGLKVEVHSPSKDHIVFKFTFTPSNY